MSVWVYPPGTIGSYFSGGEAQRIKLARELSKRQTGKTLYLLDEPTMGCIDDVKKLLDVLHRLTDLETPLYHRT